MAENANKRQAVGKGPTSSAKSPPPQPSTETMSAPGSNMISLDTALTTAVGTRLRLSLNTTHLPTIEGVINFISPRLNMLGFIERPPATTHHLIALSALKSFEILPPSAFPLPNLPPSSQLPPVDMDAGLARVNAAVAKAKEKAARKNPNVSKEAQEIFDAIGRQLPVKWEGKDIVVIDQVTVKGPGYRAEDCKAGKDVTQATLTRVKKVLENERKRLAQRDSGSKGPKPVVPAVPAIPAFSGGPKKGG